MFGLAVRNRLIMLGLALATLAPRAEAQDAGSSEKASLWTRLVGGNDRKQPEEASAPEKLAIAEAKAQAIRAGEEAAYFRRVDVCDQLMQFALDQQDVRLQKRIEELERRAWRLYVKRTSHLAVRKAASSDEERLNARLAGDRQSDEKSLVEKPARQAGEEKGRWSVLKLLRGGEQ